ncbi:hypothetical protein AB0D24_23425 [Streptomyces javensis]|uniref:hypothetical protein n=1 Tax=Streptomyces javensis TaxID=114698 RepID=UPI00340B1C50
MFTAIAANIERLSRRPPTGETPSPRPPTAFQNVLDQHIWELFRPPEMEPLKRVDEVRHRLGLPNTFGLR